MAKWVDLVRWLFLKHLKPTFWWQNNWWSWTECYLKEEKKNQPHEKKTSMFHLFFPSILTFDSKMKKKYWKYLVHQTDWHCFERSNFALVCTFSIFNRYKCGFKYALRQLSFYGLKKKWGKIDGKRKQCKSINEMTRACRTQTRPVCIASAPELLS